MLYLIGLGLNEEGFSFEGFNAIKNSRKVYLEGYTVDFPYKLEKLEEKLNKKLKIVDRDFVENQLGKLIIEAKEMNIALLIYGAPLSATTHITIIEEIRKKKIPYRVIQGASIFDGIAETGLSLYKFGMTTSMPAWLPEKNFTPDSFIEVVMKNQSIDAHTLILIDIGLSFSKALDQLEKAAKSKKLEIPRMLVCSKLGTKQSSILCKSFKEYKKEKDSLDTDIKSPYCFVIPSDNLNQVEEEILKRF